MERGWVGEVVSVKGGRGKWLTLILPSLAPEASISLSLLKQRLSTAASISIKLSCMGVVEKGPSSHTHSFTPQPLV